MRPSPFQSPNLIPSLSVAVKSFSFSVRNLDFYITDDMSIELHMYKERLPIGLL